ncbi:hypothetical protein M0R72_16560 [Candidatus Pacearchaeota archaeon]|jgi:hypothetical protein|nr:hypothetical protein [Candidatus Pacearchaeota archaeon]
MKILIALVMVALFCLSPMVSAITLDDAAAIQNSSNQFVDAGMVKKIDVSVLPTDGVIYNITANSENTKYLAQQIGVIAFSNLTYYYPEVTYGWIGIFIESPIEGVVYAPVFFDIYQSDLSEIIDRRQPSQIEALKVVNYIINNRGTKASFYKNPTILTHSNIKSDPKPSSTSPSAISSGSTTSSYSGHSSDCTPIQVKGYYRKDGTYVRPHTRKPAGC